MKAFLNQLSKWILTKYAKKNIRVNLYRYCPLPSVEVHKNNLKLIENLSKQTHLDLIGGDEEFFRIINFLLSKEANYIDGSDIAFDSGKTAS